MAVHARSFASAPITPNTLPHNYTQYCNISNLFLSLILINHVMKNIIVIVMSLLSAIYIQAQDIIEKSLPINKNAKVELEFQFADQIIIKTWDKNEAYVKAIVNINDNSDNEKFSLEATGSGVNVVFKSDIDDLEELSDRNTHYQRGVVIREDDHCIHMEIDFEVYLPASAQISLETISGNIEITGFDAPMNIKTISGFIDVSLSQNTKADIKMETITGDFYSDLDLKYEEDPQWKHHFVGGELEALLNGGGAAINLETISGNIYLRRQ